MGTYRKLPVEIEAVQFTGDNWAEMHDFTGHRPATDNVNHPIDIFNSMGTYLLDYDHVGYDGELWVEANQSWLPVQKGEWVIKDKLGFYPCKDEVFKETYAKVEEPYEEENPIRVLDETDSIDRMLGRVRFSLIVARRPQSEVDLISERMAQIIAEHKVLMEHTTGLSI